jgi:hypothetical protein
MCFVKAVLKLPVEAMFNSNFSTVDIKKFGCNILMQANCQIFA